MSHVAGPFAIAAALCAVWAFRPVALSDPARCAGALESVLPLALRQLRHVPVGFILLATNGVLAFLSLTLFIRLAHRLSGSLWIAAAIAAALVATSLFDRHLAPAPALALLAAACYAWLVLTRSPLDAAVASGTWLRAALALMTFLVIAPEIAVPRLACSPSDADAFAFVDAVRSATTAIGPFPFVVAGFGLFGSGVWYRHRRGWAILAIALLPLLSGAWRVPGSASVMPAIAGFWCLVALGARQLAEEAGRVRRVGVAMLIALIPVLQWQTLDQRDLGTPASEHGHDRLSFQTVWDALRALPEVRLVAEDASTDLLLRAAAPPLKRLGKSVEQVRREMAHVASARAGGRLFAFPRMQVDLQHRGVRFDAHASRTIGEFNWTAVRAAGLAEVEAVHPCVVTGPDWREATAVLTTMRFSLVATQAQARGPVNIYVAAQGPVKASPLHWHHRDRRGFIARMYADDRARIRAAMTDQGVPLANPVQSLPQVLALYIWRTQAAPDVLTVELSARPEAAIAREEAGEGRPGIALCPSFPFVPLRIGL